MTIEAMRTTIGGNPQEITKAAIRVEYGCVNIGFAQPRGYGESGYEVSIKPDSFDVVAQAMMQTNPEAPIKAFGNAMKDGVPKPRERWYPGCATA